MAWHTGNKQSGGMVYPYSRTFHTSITMSYKAADHPIMRKSDATYAWQSLPQINKTVAPTCGNWLSHMTASCQSHMTVGFQSHMTAGFQSHMTVGCPSHMTAGCPSHVAAGCLSHMTADFLSHMTAGCLSH